MLVNYYRPKITPAAADGSLKYGVTLKTEVWTSQLPNKIKVEIHGETEEIARQKLKNFIKHQNFIHEWPAAVITEKPKV
jgi:hypothetical protein